MALFVEGLDVDCPKMNVGISQVGRISKEYHGIFDRQVYLHLKLMLRLSQAQLRQSGEREDGKDQEREREKKWHS